MTQLQKICLAATAISFLVAALFLADMIRMQWAKRHQPRRASVEIVGFHWSPENIGKPKYKWMSEAEFIARWNDAKPTSESRRVFTETTKDAQP